MEDLSQKLETVLQNPQIMQQIMAMASSLNAGQSPPSEPHPEPTSPPPGMDLAMLQKLSQLASQSGVDPQQQSLLQALTPYLTGERIHRLERAMRAAKTARLATELLGSGGLNFLSGR